MSISLSLRLAALRSPDGTVNELPEVRGAFDAQDGGAGPGSAWPAVAKTAGCASGLLLGHSAHPLMVAKAGFLSNFLDRQPSLLEHVSGGLKTKILDGAGRRLTGLCAKQPGKLPRAEGRGVAASRPLRA
jgi:hypothetical protein